MNRGKFRARGFTLLEILVVVIIIGVLTAMLLPNLSLGGRWRELQREATTLAVRIRAAQDDAMLYGREYGVVFNEAGYLFVAWDAVDGRFRTVRDAPQPWMHQDFAEGITIAASADEPDAILVLPEPTDEEVATPVDDAAAKPAVAADDEPRYEPSVFVLSSGEVTPFTAVFRADGEEQQVELRVDALGNRVDESRQTADAPSS